MPGSRHPVRGASVVVLFLYAAALLAALTQVVQRVTDVPARAGVFVPGFVRPGVSVGVALLAVVVFGLAVVAVYQGHRYAWLYCTALAVAGLVLAVRDDGDWVMNALLLVVLALPGTHRDLGA